jgi:hypothetical protein
MSTRSLAGRDSFTNLKSTNESDEIARLGSYGGEDSPLDISRVR